MLKIPGYRIIRPIGRGGMAEVYLAIQESFEREVALKVMDDRAGRDSAYSQRFLSEARIVSRLMHPNIVTVYDVGIADGHHFLSMEFIPGEDLKKARRRLSLSRRMEVVKDIARALDYAGRKGYVHRDVKPENIMLHQDDGRAVLMDFGIARASDVADGMTNTGIAIGTPHYMSPEQASGQAVDPRSDIYSLGVLFYLMLTNYVPYNADSAVAVGVKHVSEPIPKLPEHLQTFQPIIERAMAKIPGRRYQTAAEMLADIEQIPRYSIESVEKVQSRAVEVVVDRPQHDTPVRGGRQHNAVLSAAMTEQNWPAGELHTGSSDAVAPPDEAAGSRGSSVSWGWLLGVVIAAAVVYVVFRLQQLPVDERTRVLGTLLGTESEAPQVPAPENIPSATVIVTEQPDATGEVLPAPGNLSSPAALQPALSAGESRQALLSRAQQLLENLETDPSGVVEIAAIYRQLIENNPIDIEAGQGLQSLRALMIDRIEAALARRDFRFAHSQLQLAGQAFTAESFVAKLQNLLQKIAVEEQVTSLLSTAQQYLAKEWLTSPQGSNAAALYDQVLELQPDNETAISGLEEIAAHYVSLAQGHLAKGELARAQAALDTGLSVRDRHPGLLAIESQLERMNRIERLADEARRQAAAGRLLAPAGNNSLQSWRDILQIDPLNSEAQQSVARIHGDLVSGVENSIREERWDDARANIARALAHFPDSHELQALKLINEQAITDAGKPRVTGLLVGDSALNGVSGPQSQQLRAGPTLYAGFEFDRILPPESLQARLYSGVMATEISRTELPLVQASGVRFFTLENGSKNFPSGIYRLDLLHQGVVLASRNFRIRSMDGEAAENP